MKRKQMTVFFFSGPQNEMESPNLFIRRLLISLFVTSASSPWLIMSLWSGIEIPFPDQLSVLEKEYSSWIIFFRFGCCFHWCIRSWSSSISFPKIIFVTVFMAVMTCCKHFRRVAEVCNLCVEPQAFYRYSIRGSLLTQNFLVSQSLGIAHFRFSGRTLWDRFGHENESAFLKISAQSSEAGDFLNIFLRFFAFWGSFSYKNFSYKKKRVRRQSYTWLKTKMLEMYLE